VRNCPHDLPDYVCSFPLQRFKPLWALSRLNCTPTVPGHNRTALERMMRSLMVDDRTTSYRGCVNLLSYNIVVDRCGPWSKSCRHGAVIYIIILLFLQLPNLSIDSYYCTYGFVVRYQPSLVECELASALCIQRLVRTTLHNWREYGTRGWSRQSCISILIKIFLGLVQGCETITRPKVASVTTFVQIFAKFDLMALEKLLQVYKLANDNAIRWSIDILGISDTSDRRSTNKTTARATIIS